MESKIILPTSKETSGVSVPLIAFDTIVDTDFGLMLLIDRNYLDKSVFDIEFFNTHHTIRDMVLALSEREKYNPLTLCLRKDKQDLADDLYNSFMNEHYKEILELSVATGISEFLELTNTSDGDVKPIVVYRKQEELEYFDKYYCKTHKYNTISLEELMRDFDRNIGTKAQQIILKYVFDEYSYKILPNIYDRTIYFGNYKFNLVERDDPRADKLLVDFYGNEINTIEIYSSAKLHDQEDKNNGTE